MTESLRVFLCHDSQDKQKVRDLCKQLLSDSFDVWLDEIKLLPGQEWAIEIPRAVRNSHIVIVCLSHKSISKEGYVQKEIKFALDIADEKPDGTIFLIPMRLDDCEVPDRLRKWHWVDYFETNGYEKLKNSLSLKMMSLGLNKFTTNVSSGQITQNTNISNSITATKASETTSDLSDAITIQKVLEVQNNIPDLIATPKVIETKDDLSALLIAKRALDTTDNEKQIPDFAINTYSSLIKKGMLLDKIIHDLQLGVYSHPTQIILWQTLGDAYLRANRLSESLDAYDKAENLLR